MNDVIIVFIYCFFVFNVVFPLHSPSVLAASFVTILCYLFNSICICIYTSGDVFRFD